jgi:hypothetical protein
MHLYTVIVDSFGISLTEGFRLKQVRRGERGGICHVLNDSMISAPLHRSLTGRLIDDRLLDGYVHCQSQSRRCTVGEDLKKPRHDDEGVLVHVRVRLPAGAACNISLTAPEGGPGFKPVGFHIHNRRKQSFIIHIPHGQHMYVYVNKFLIGVFVSKGTNLEMSTLSPVSAEKKVTVAPSTETTLSPTIERRSLLVTLLGRLSSFRRVLKARLFPNNAPTKYPDRRVESVDIR